MSATRRDADGPASSFYASAIDSADRLAELGDARRVEGLDEEVALLRMLLRDGIRDHPDDLKLLQGGMRLLVQTLTAQHRLSPKQADNLGEAVANVLQEFGEALGTAEQDLDHA